MHDFHSRDLRSGKFHETGNYVFVTTNLHNRVPLFNERRFAQIVLNAIGWLEDNRKIDLIIAVLMPNHLHMILGLEENSLEKVMHSLKSFTSNQINKERGFRGTVWQSGYFEKIIRGEGHMRELISYCLANPVKAGLVDTWEEYPYFVRRIDVEGPTHRG